MNISEKRYPYPVLKPDGDDYEGSVFDVAIEVTKTPDLVSVVFVPTLRDDGLRRLIGVEKAAEIVCHLECPRTVFRTVVRLALPVCETAGEGERLTLEIPAAALSGEVSVCPFIVATSDIPAYTNDAFNPDYECEAFAIETGAVMAEGRQKTFSVETAREALAQEPSIFTVVPGPADCKTMRMDWSGQKILVFLPQKTFEQYGTIKDNPEDRETIWAMVFVPALVEILATLATTRRLAPESMSEYSENGWYRAIDRAVRRLRNYSVDSDEFANCGSCVELASLIIKNSVCSAFTKMTVGWAQGGAE